MKARVFLFVLPMVFLLPNHLLGAEDAEILVARGIEKIQAGNPDGAVEVISAALQAEPDDPEANFYLGLAYSRLGRYEEAERALLRSLALDPTAAETCFELCLVASRLGRCDAARDYLAKLRLTAPDAEQLETASEFVSGCGEEAPKPYYLNLTAGGQYDTNVILDSNPQDTGAKQGDFRGLLFLAAGVTPWRREQGAVHLDYDFYQSFHTELTDYNLTYNRVTPSVEIKLFDSVVPSAGYAFNYTFLWGERYNLTHEGYATVRVLEGEQFSTEGRYTYANLTYWDTDLFQANSDRTGYRNSVAVRQGFNRDKLTLSLEGAGDFERTAMAWWGYDGFRFAAEGWYEFLPALHAGVEVCYGERRYREAFPGSGSAEKRFDQQVDGTLAVTYLFSNRLGVTLANTTSGNFSNLGLFEYTRNVTGLFFTVGAL